MIIGIVLVSGYSRETALVVIAVGVAKAFEAISDVYYGLLQHHERMDRISQSMIIKGILSLGALCIGVYLTHSAFWGTMFLATSWAVVLLAYDIPSGSIALTNRLPTRDAPINDSQPYVVTRPRWRTRVLLKLSWMALPLGLVLMLISLNVSIPRYFLEGNLGTRELGIFAAIAYLERVGTTIADALAQSASPRLAKDYASGNTGAYSLLLTKLIGIALLLGILSVGAVAVAGNQILTLLYGLRIYSLL